MTNVVRMPISISKSGLTSSNHFKNKKLNKEFKSQKQIQINSEQLWRPGPFASQLPLGIPDNLGY